MIKDKDHLICLTLNWREEQVIHKEEEKITEDGGKDMSKAKSDSFCCQWTEVSMSAEVRRRRRIRMREENERRRTRTETLIIGRNMLEQGAEETNEGALDLLRCRPSSSHARSQCEDSGGRADNKCLLKKELGKPAMI